MGVKKLMDPTPIRFPKYFLTSACSYCGDRATTMTSSEMENPTDKDGLLLKRQLCPLFPILAPPRRLNARPLLSLEVDTALPPSKVK